MSNFSNNIDKCFFSKRDTSIFVEGVEDIAKNEKVELLRGLALKHKVTAIEFDASKSIDMEAIIQSLYYEVEMLIGFDVSKNLAKYSDEKIFFVLLELLKDAAITFHMEKPIDKGLILQLQRLSLTLRRYTRSRMRLIFLCDQKMFDHCIDAGLRLEYVKLFFSGIPERSILEMTQSVDAEIKLERRSIERFLGEYIETVKLRPRVRSFLGNL